MLALSPRHPAFCPQKKVLILGVGGAATHVLSLLPEGEEEGRIDLVALNTDARLVSEFSRGRSLSLGQSLLRGMSCGGDVELGLKVAQMDEELLDGLFADYSLIILVGGLGGGTGSGVLPFLAQKAQESGALVAGLVTLPFSFEGMRREMQAKQAKQALLRHTHLLLCFENDRMGELVSGEEGILAAYRLGNLYLAQTILSLVEMTGQSGLLSLGLDELSEILGVGKASLLFSYGQRQVQGLESVEALIEEVWSSPCLTSLEGKSPAGILAWLKSSPDVPFGWVLQALEKVRDRVPEGGQLHIGLSASLQGERQLALFLLAREEGEEASPELCLEPPMREIKFDSSFKGRGAPLSELREEENSALNLETIEEELEMRPEEPLETSSCSSPDRKASLEKPSLNLGEGSGIELEGEEILELDLGAGGEDWLEDELDLPPSQRRGLRISPSSSPLEPSMPVEVEPEPYSPEYRAKRKPRSSSSLEKVRPARPVASSNVEDDEYLPFTRREGSITPPPPHKPEEKEALGKPPEYVEKGRFSGDVPNLIGGEDLDLPPALRQR